MMKKLNDLHIPSLIVLIFITFQIGYINLLPLLFRGFFPGSMAIGSVIVMLIIAGTAYFLQATNGSVWERPQGYKLLFTLMVFFLMYLTIIVISQLYPSPVSDNQAEINYINTHIGAINQLFFKFTLIFLAPLFEELLFRGWLVWSLAGWGKTIQFILPTLLFTLVHGPSRLADWLTYGSLATLLMIIRFYTKKVQYPMFAHIIWNAFSSF
ncbi:CPBP family intramembrane glutamic endopeptidase [Convivina intestini]|uniref:CPBP family intramembrane glutamic endopeptidase n=1 Tax=Convivina intestini TaxID=1505726 RepID=UPI00200C3673|nr:type II CAAX endopeptidase family protein [Convivina intestini]CAH1853371.1 hypothetical protein R078131_00760 [Convivina intestini]